MRARLGLESEHELKGCVGVRRWDWDRAVKPSSIRDGYVTEEEQGGVYPHGRSDHNTIAEFAEMPESRA